MCIRYDRQTNRALKTDALRATSCNVTVSPASYNVTVAAVVGNYYATSDGQATFSIPFACGCVGV